MDTRLLLHLIFTTWDAQRSPEPSDLPPWSPLLPSSSKELLLLVDSWGPLFQTLLFWICVS